MPPRLFFRLLVYPPPPCLFEHHRSPLVLIVFVGAPLPASAASRFHCVHSSGTACLLSPPCPFDHHRSFSCPTVSAGALPLVPRPHRVHSSGTACLSPRHVRSNDTAHYLPNRVPSSASASLASHHLLSSASVHFPHDRVPSSATVSLPTACFPHTCPSFISCRWYMATRQLHSIIRWNHH